MIKADIFIKKEIRKQIIEFALEQYGKEYIHGKRGPDSFDCAGFAWYLYKQICGINIFASGIGKSTTTKIMTSSYGVLRLYKEEDLNKNLNLINSGDILLFHRQSIDDDMPREDNKFPGHCGIYLSDNSFIQCSSVKGKVIISNFEENNYWTRVLVASKDIVSDDWALRKIK